MTKTGFSLLIALSLAASAAAPAPGSSDGQLQSRPGQATAARPVARGQIAYLGDGASLYLPATSAGTDGALPLLVVLPGTGGNGRDMVAFFRGAADAAHFALLGLTPPRSGNFDAIDNFFDDYEARRPSALAPWPQPRFGRDVARIDAALAKTFAAAPIDHRRIGLLGFSHGGSYALTLGTANPRLFASIAAISPGILVIRRESRGAQAVFLAHSPDDAVQPYRRTACRMAPALARLGYDVEFMGFAGGHTLPGAVASAAVSHFLSAPPLTEQARKTALAEPPRAEGCPAGN